MFKHTFHHIYKVLYMVVQLSNRSNVYNISIRLTFCEVLTSYTLGCVIQHGTKLFSCLFHAHLSGLGRFSIGINNWAQTNVAWYKALRTCCSNESCVGGKFSSCWSYWTKSCYLHLFTSYLGDPAWYIKQKNLSMVFISLSITSAVGLLHSFTKLSVNCR